MLLESINCLPKSFQQLLLNSFSIIPPVDIVFICQNMIEVLVPGSNGESPSTLDCCEYWALITSRFILRHLSLEGVQYSFLRGTLSDYRCMIFGKCYFHLF